MAYINSLSTHNGRIGKLGEDLAAEYLVSLGHAILERNYKNKIGEIDIISKFGVVSRVTGKVTEKIHVVEVKTSQSRNVKPEENMHAVKMKKVARLAQMYAKNNLYCIDFIGVSLNRDGSLQKITYLENLEIY